MTTLYLDYKNGDDTNTGGSGDPLKTLAHCLAVRAARACAERLAAGAVR